MNRMNVHLINSPKKLNLNLIKGWFAVGLILAASGCTFEGGEPPPDNDGSDSTHWRLSRPSQISVAITNSSNQPIPGLDPDPLWASLVIEETSDIVHLNQFDVGLSDLVVSQDVGGASVPLHLTDVRLGIKEAHSAPLDKATRSAIVPIDLELNWSLVGRDGGVAPLPGQVLPDIALAIIVPTDLNESLAVDIDIDGLLWDFGEIAVADLEISLTLENGDS